MSLPQLPQNPLKSPWCGLIQDKETCTAETRTRTYQITSWNNRLFCCWLNIWMDVDKRRVCWHYEHWLNYDCTHFKDRSQTVTLDDSLVQTFNSPSIIGQRGLYFVFSTLSRIHRPFVWSELDKQQFLQFYRFESKSPRDNIVHSKSHWCVYSFCSYPST